MALSISVPVSIWHDQGIVESNPPGQPSAKVIYTCRQEDRYQLVRDLLGVWTGSTVGNIQRTYPYQYPPSPNLIVRSIDSIEFYGSPSILSGLVPLFGRKMCRVSVSYGPAVWDAFGSSDPTGQPYSRTSISIGGEKVTVPGSVYNFAGNVTTNVPVAITMPTAQISVQRFMLPFAPIAEIISIAGGVNVAPWVWPTVTYDGGTVLFLGGDLEVSFDSLGNVTWNCTYKFSWRAIRWNRYLHPDGISGWTTVVDGNGNSPYAGVDFSILP
jgi:hypothetical protein